MSNITMIPVDPQNGKGFAMMVASIDVPIARDFLADFDNLVKTNAKLVFLNTLLQEQLNNPELV